MITNVITKGSIVTYSNPSNPYISPGSQSAGMVRYNTNMQQMEVYDGVSWLKLGGSCEVGLTNEAEMIISWAREKMLEEQKLDELCKKYPGLERARANFEIFKRLVQAEASVQESVQSSP